MFFPGVNYHFPAHGSRQFRQCNFQVLPVGVGSDIDHFGTGEMILSGKHDSYIPFMPGKFGVPGCNAVEACVRKSAGAAAYICAEESVFLTELYHILEECKNIMVILQSVPVEPGSNIVVAVGIIVAELGVAELISCEEHWDSTAAHQESEGVADHRISMK